MKDINIKDLHFMARSMPVDEFVQSIKAKLTGNPITTVIEDEVVVCLKASGISAEEWMKEHCIKDTSQYWSEKDKRAYKLSELINHFTHQPKQNGVIRNDRIVDKNIHPSTGKESGMGADEIHKIANQYLISNPDDTPYFTKKGAEIIFNQFASNGREKEEYGKLRSDEDGHDYIIPESKVEAYDEFMRGFEMIGCRGESEDAYYVALDRFEKDWGKYQIDGKQRDYRILLHNPPK